MNIKDIKKTLDSKINAIKAHIEVIAYGKFPHANITSKTEVHLLWNDSGMHIIDREYRCRINIQTTAPESSHPELKRPISNIQLTIALRSDGTYSISQYYPTDQVDVHYCKFDKKTNRRNITIARKWHRRAIKYFQTTFKKHVPHSGDLQPDEAEALRIYNQYLTETDKLKAELRKVYRRIVPSKDDLRKMRKNEKNFIRATLRPNLTFGKELGLTYENHTFYHNGEKLARRTAMQHYINNNPKFFIPEFKDNYPLLAIIED